MLRWTVAVVLVLNGLFLAWSQRWLAPLGLQPRPTGEPERTSQQIRPGAIRLMPDTPQNVPPPTASTD